MPIMVQGAPNKNTVGTPDENTRVSVKKTWWMRIQLCQLSFNMTDDQLKCWEL